MFINNFNNFNFFFKTTVTDNRPEMRLNRTVSRFFWRMSQASPLWTRISDIFRDIIFDSSFHLLVSNNCERFADSCLAESRYWWGGKKIELYVDHVIVNKEERSFTTIVDKVKSLATAFFLFLPGVLLKNLAWWTNFCQIDRRNQLITEYLNRKQNCAKQYGLNRVKPIEFAMPVDGQTESVFMLLPLEIKMHILSFLEEDRDRARLALTCKKNYCLTAQFDNLPSVIFQSMTKNLSAVIIQSIGKDALMNLPHEALSESVHLLCQEFGLHTEFLDHTLPIHTNHAQILITLLRSEDYPKLIEKFFNWMGSHAIKTIPTAEGLGLTIRLKNNLPENFSNQEQQALIITKIKGKWTVSGINTSGSMWLFLNDMRFSNNLPEVKDYLERLFRGEPCGNFSDTLNRHVQVNYQESRAGSLLQEGPRTCPDGVTPVMQLWSA